MLEESTCYIDVAKGHLLLFSGFIQGYLGDDMAQITIIMDNVKSLIESKINVCFLHHWINSSIV